MPGTNEPSEQAENEEQAERNREIRYRLMAALAKVLERLADWL